MVWPWLLTIRLLTSFFLCLIHIPTSSSFQVLPYVHIDYEYYFRLAQCQAQCVEKYGVVGYRRRLDGSVRSHFNTSNNHYSVCQLGCQNARLKQAPTGKRARPGEDDDAFRDGQQFWISSEQGAVPQKKLTLSSTQLQNVDRSPIASLRVLCLRPSSSVQGSGYLDSYSALLNAQPFKVEFLAAVRYLVQWKQRLPIGGNKNQEQQRYDETKWITASIEPDLTFIAEGLQPGVQYRFMIMVISGGGRMGPTVTSEWIEAPLLGAPMPTVPLPLVVTPQFNSDDNVSAVISFRREGASNRRMSLVTTCAYHLRYTNSSQQIYSVDFEMDESEGFLLTNLAFNTQYDVEMQPLAQLPSSTNMAIELSSNKGLSSTAQFRTISCADVFGGGSLQCEPEPVKDLDIKMNEENSTVVLTWNPSTEARHVLLYELRFLSVARDKTKCTLDESTLYLPAKATRAEIALPDSECEVEVYLTNYDLRGREASVTARFMYRPRRDEELNMSFYNLDSLSTNIWIIISAPLLVIIALLIILRFAAIGQRRLKKKISSLNAQRTLESTKPVCSGLPPPVNV